jgi:two-component system sensor histidine kinase AlgZ
MRYHKEINVQFKIQIDDDCSIMPLLFIILLENAFKHRIENLAEKANFHLNIQANSKRIFLKIENNFDILEPKLDNGIGLKNLKRRLELVYPQKHTLSFSTIENVYKAKLTLQL